MAKNKALSFVIATTFVLLLAAGSRAAVPEPVNFQGKLTDIAGVPLDGDFTLEFSICDDPDVGFGTCAWSEVQSVTIVKGVYSVALGSETPFPPDLFSAIPLYLQVGIRTDPGDPSTLDVLEPRLPLTSTPFAKHAAFADAANETDPTVPASIKDGVSWSEVSSKPAGFADNVDDVGLTAETDPTVPASVKDGVSWSEVSSKPAGFADNIDDVGLTSESDPQVGSNTTNYVPRWNSSALVTGSIYDSGYIGIGTTTPVRPLEVAGGVALGTGGQNAIWLGNVEGLTNADVRVARQGYAYTFAVGNTSDNYFAVRNTGNAFFNYNLGIGTTSPASNLHVRGSLRVDEPTGAGVLDVSASAVRLGGATGGNDVDLVVTDPTIDDEVFRFDAGYGSLYLGSGDSTTAGEAGELYLFNGSGSYGARLYGSSGTLYLGYGTSTTTGNAGEFYLYDDNGTSSIFGYGSTAIMYLGYGSATTPGEDGDIYIRNNAGSSTIIMDGDTGRVTARRLQLTGGADLSEHFDIRRQDRDIAPLPGFLVSIDAEHPGELLVSRTAYDRTVAGIVSGANGINPGLTLVQEGTETEGQFPVALSGRVYAWADATRHPIVPGDLLTTSDTPGHAMKVADHTRANGSVIGKAMTGLGEGRGLVLVLVSLQ